MTEFKYKVAMSPKLSLRRFVDVSTLNRFAKLTLFLLRFSTEPDSMYETRRDCTVDEFQCDGGRCIKASWVCDYVTDCDDGTDEAYCPAEGSNLTTTTTIAG